MEPENTILYRNYIYKHNRSTIIKVEIPLDKIDEFRINEVIARHGYIDDLLNKNK